MSRLGKYGTGTVYRFFDSWNEVLSTIGLEPNGRQNIPNEELLNALRSLADELGRPPTQTEMTEKGEFSVNTYRYFPTDVRGGAKASL